MRSRWVAYGVVLAAFFEQQVWLPVFTAVPVAGWAVAYGQTAYSLANLAGNVAAGLLADRLGRRRVAGASLVAAGATALLHLLPAVVRGTAPEAAWVGARLAHGLAIAGVVPSVFALVADSSAVTDRARAFARSGVAIAVASIAASGIGGVLVQRLGVTVTVGTLAAMLAGMGLVALAALPAVPPAHSGSSGRPMVRVVPGALGAALLGAAALMFGQNVLTFAVPLHIRTLGLGPQTTGALFATFGLTALAVFLGLGRLADRRGRVRTMGAGLALVASAQGLLAAGGALPVLGLAMAVYGTGFGMTFPAIAALAGDGAPPERRGLAMGMLGATFSLGAAAGPMAARFLSPWLSPFAVGSAVVTGILALIGVWHRYGRPRPAIPPAGREY